MQCVYAGRGSVIIDHDTLLNTHPQTGATWVGEDFGNIYTYTVENSILAGGAIRFTVGAQAGNRGRPGWARDYRKQSLFSHILPEGWLLGGQQYFDRSKTTWSGTCGTPYGRAISR